ncbi:hypothetical protein SDC9_106020 [bioreactor metagenome]|uniref:Uncharacterized protein n=1 Tax=bioreactor metagenome TaxID=1076179 RepID=A0A645B159_9ZZZZ
MLHDADGVGPMIQLVGVGAEAEEALSLFQKTAELCNRPILGFLSPEEGYYPHALFHVLADLATHPYHAKRVFAFNPILHLLFSFDSQTEAYLGERFEHCSFLLCIRWRHAMHHLESSVEGCW